jgi:peptidoglycan/LPS O-acetylase OafA/YrhL
MLPAFDIRLLMYFPSFLVGIFVAGEKDSISGMKIYHLITLALISLALSFIDTTHPEKSLGSIPIAVAVPLLILVSGLRFGSKIKSNKFIYIISFSSFFMYLFHRPLYKLMTHIYLPDTTIPELMYLFMLCLPTVIVFSFIGQKSYDYLIETTLEKSSR